MHTLRFMAAILLLVPLAAQAESEYTACLKGLHQQSSVLLASRWPSQQRVPSVLKSDNSTHRFEPAASPAVVKFSLDMYPSRLSPALVQACRQYRKTSPSRMKVVGIKSPAFRNTETRPE